MFKPRHKKASVFVMMIQMQDNENSSSSEPTEEFGEAKTENLRAIANERDLHPQDTVASFETDHGSVYTYDDTGRTSRYKTATGEQHEAQDVTVFVSLSPDETQQVLRAYRPGLPTAERNAKVYVIEQTDEITGTIIRTRDQIENPVSLFLASIVDGTVQLRSRASLFPQIGAHVFDTRHFQADDGNSYTERHLGNKVSKINYK